MSRGPITYPVVLPVRLTVDDRERLGRYAKNEGSTPTQVARLAIRRACDLHEAQRAKWEGRR